MNTKQREAFDTVLDGKNLFLTGAAGTGKTYVLKLITEWACKNGFKIGITASTGLAAYLIKGRTIHSFLGIGLGKKSAQDLANYVRKKNQVVYSRIRALHILAIDEVSMVNDEFIDKISEFLSIIREDPAPFGGLQVILCGDMCQLPPVEGNYAFMAKTWKAANVHTVVLEELVRQDKDVRFQDMLQELRWGLCSKDVLKILKSLTNTTFQNGIIPTRLYSVNVDVDKINANEFNKLVKEGNQIMSYAAKYSSHPSAEAWSQSVKIPNNIDLCVGAQVMVTWNLSAFSEGNGNLVNGTRGVVSDIAPEGAKIKLVSGEETIIEYITVACEDNDKMSVSFMPLKLAYAITIHKSQGMTLDAVEVDLGSSIFEYGQAYTALSRAKTLDSVRVIDVRSKSFRTHPKVKEFYGVK